MLVCGANGVINYIVQVMNNLFRYTVNLKNKKLVNLRRDEVPLNALNSVLIDLPVPINISYMWKFGSLIGVYFFFQILTGIFLAMHYVSSTSDAFESIKMITREVHYGWVIHLMHVVGASGFFMFLYLHAGRGLYYWSFTMTKTWFSGVTIFILRMATAFLGYVLPWGQMSYWGATVITKFLSVVPYIGQTLVIWVWGSFAVDYPTLTRFFALHYLLPFIILAFVFMHVIYLHETGSNNPLGLNTSGDKVPFFPYFLFKDVVGFIIRFILVYWVFMIMPEGFVEYQNFTQANSLITPTHIQPEWYFLSAYAVLRAIPNKLGGVLALVLFIVILYIFPMLVGKNVRNNGFILISQILWWVWVVKFFILTWVGACPVEDPYILLSRIGCVTYFRYFILIRFIVYNDNKTISYN